MKRAILALVLAAGAAGPRRLSNRKWRPIISTGMTYQLQARARSLGHGNLRRTRNIKRAQKMAVHTRATSRKGSPRRSRDWGPGGDNPFNFWSHRLPQRIAKCYEQWRSDRRDSSVMPGRVLRTQSPMNHIIACFQTKHAAYGSLIVHPGCAARSQASCL
jgi:hypothetical protein